MPDPTNTFTVTFADAHSHTVVFAAIAASSKADALLNVAQNCAQAVSTLTATDTFTITVTQP